MGKDDERDLFPEAIRLINEIIHKLLNASDFGVPQLRPRVVIIGIRKDENGIFSVSGGKTGMCACRGGIII